MRCTAKGCDRDIRYRSLELCQKHYFRLWRTGTTDARKPNPRLVTPNGYVRVYAPDHTLAEKNGYVLEHRKVAFDDINGELKSCSLCGIDIDWTNCHVDHIDNNRQNNAPENLRPTCIGCNVMRSRLKPQHEYAHFQALTCRGRTMTPTEWARQPGVVVSASTIRRQLKLGSTPEHAIYGEKITHRLTIPKKTLPKFKNGKRVSL